MLTQHIALGVIADSGGLRFIPKEAQSYLKGKAGCCRSNEVVHSQFVYVASKNNGYSHIAPCHQ